jgi:cytochrome c oxidase cbb3-type subunit 2
MSLFKAALQSGKAVDRLCRWPSSSRPRSAAWSRSRRSSPSTRRWRTLPDMRVYTPLELAGRDIYIREGCYACHSQMIRTLRDEVDRYGPYSLAGESAYDHPMLWGSKRTGPDLARTGRQVFRRLARGPSDQPARCGAGLDHAGLSLADVADRQHLAVLRRLGVPYTDEMIANAPHDALDECHGTCRPLRRGDHLRPFSGADRLTEMDALVPTFRCWGSCRRSPMRQRRHHEP